MRSSRISGLFVLIWLVVGVALAADRNYFEDVDTVKEVASAALAVVLWPLLLLDINLNIK